MMLWREQDTALAHLMNEIFPFFTPPGKLSHTDIRRRLFPAEARDPIPLFLVRTSLCAWSDQLSGNGIDTDLGFFGQVNKLILSPALGLSHMDWINSNPGRI